MKQELDEFNNGDASWSVGPMSEELRYHVIFFQNIYWSEQNFYSHYKTAEYMDTSHEFLHTIQPE